MRIRLALSLLGVATIIALGMPGGASAQVASEDSVTGTALLIEGGLPFRFDAHSGPSGENPRGSIDLRFGDGTVVISANVICLAVDGNRATIRADFQGLFESVFFVEDNDGSGSDRLNSVGGELVPTACPVDPPAGVALFPVLSGDIEVVDAQPFPTSPDQCKNGGWRNFPDFKNQGQCVAFVERKAKPPAG